MTLAVTAVFLGASSAIINVPPLNSKIQRAVPTELRGGRVFSALALLVNASAPWALLWSDRW